MEPIWCRYYVENIEHIKINLNVAMKYSLGGNYKHLVCVSLHVVGYTEIQPNYCTCTCVPATLFSVYCNNVGHAFLHIWNISAYDVWKLDVSFLVVFKWMCVMCQPQFSSVRIFNY